MSKPTEIAEYTLDTVVGASDLTLGQMVKMYKEAPNKREQLQALSDLSCLPQETIKKLLLANGVSQSEMPRKRRSAPEETPAPPPPKNEIHGILDQMQEALAAAGNAAAKLAALCESRDRAASEAQEKLARLREVLSMEDM